MTKYEDIIKSLDKHIVAIDHWRCTCTESGVSSIPENIIESLVKDYKELKKCIVSTTSVKSGHWIDLGDHIQCSCCKATRLTEFRSYYGKTKRLVSDYCPDCGVKMTLNDDECKCYNEVNDMHDFIKSIINSNQSSADKTRLLNDIKGSIEIAEKVLSGEYKYCPECDDYYLAESFITKPETEKIRICTYSDPINSGSDEYADGFAVITYSICPKGHKHEIHREERSE